MPSFLAGVGQLSLLAKLWLKVTHQGQHQGQSHVLASGHNIVVYIDFFVDCTILKCLGEEI